MYERNNFFAARRGAVVVTLTLCGRGGGGAMRDANSIFRPGYGNVFHVHRRRRRQRLLRCAFNWCMRTRTHICGSSLCTNTRGRSRK